MSAVGLWTPSLTRALTGDQDYTTVSPGGVPGQLFVVRYCDHPNDSRSITFSNDRREVFSSKLPEFGFHRIDHLQASARTNYDVVFPPA
jgi:hypothetical protein